MIKIFLRKFSTILITSQFYFNYTWAQELPVDPVLPPKLVKSELNEVDSRELFDVLIQWKLVVIDRPNQTQNIRISDVNCVENLEDGRSVGCSLFDDFRLRELTKYNKLADPLFKLMVKHVSLDCDDDSETCIAIAEKIVCSLSANTYSCHVEYLLPQPKTKPENGDQK